MTEARGSASALRTYTLDKRVPYFQFSFPLSEPRAFDSYQVEISNTGSQRIAFAENITPVRFNGEPRFYVGFRSALFTKGQYQLRLTGLRGGNPTTLGLASIQLQFE